MLDLEVRGRTLTLYEDADASVGTTGQALVDALEPVADELRLAGPVAVSWEPGNCTRYDFLLALRDHFTTDRARPADVRGEFLGRVTPSPSTPWVGYPDDEPALMVAKLNGDAFVHVFRLHDRFLDLDYVAEKLGRRGQPGDLSTAAVVANMVLVLGALLDG